MPCFFASFGDKDTLERLILIISIFLIFSSSFLHLSGLTHPILIAIGDSLKSALSALRVSLYSALEVNIL